MYKKLETFQNVVSSRSIDRKIDQNRVTTRKDFIISQKAKEIYSDSEIKPKMNASKYSQNRVLKQSMAVKIKQSHDPSPDYDQIPTTVCDTNSIGPLRRTSYNVSSTASSMYNQSVGLNNQRFLQSDDKLTEDKSK